MIQRNLLFSLLRILSFSPRGDSGFVGLSINLQCGGAGRGETELAGQSQDAERTAAVASRRRGHFIISAWCGGRPLRLSRKNSGTTFPARHE